MHSLLMTALFPMGFWGFGVKVWDSVFENKFFFVVVKNEVHSIYFRSLTFFSSLSLVRVQRSFWPLLPGLRSPRAGSLSEPPVPCAS